MTQSISGKTGLPVNAVVKAWLIVATLDITAAIIQTLIAGGTIERLMRYIASGVYGPKVFLGGSSYPIQGLLFHYMIAGGWTVLFFLIYPKLKFAASNKVVTGVGYGIFVWFMMNRVVLPMSNVTMREFDLQRAIIAAFVLVVAIGIPLSYMASRHYSGKS